MISPAVSEAEKGLCDKSQALGRGLWKQSWIILKQVGQVKTPGRWEGKTLVGLPRCGFHFFMNPVSDGGRKDTLEPRGGESRREDESDVACEMWRSTRPYLVFILTLSRLQECRSSTSPPPTTRTRPVSFLLRLRWHLFSVGQVRGQVFPHHLAAKRGRGSSLRPFSVALLSALQALLSNGHGAARFARAWSALLSQCRQSLPMWAWDATDPQIVGFPE